ncbi:hypothetical protein [Burkholderia vietnamiensis]|uniref:hypothetical protein n=1 Tax=Burkholderia vietnamiensis TaxID=60552 RepID=UPI001B9DD1E1|nr:hypothetical protein [Burkholderia vietnamiensis]MBR8283636.1 hypothetical protein [Burkholderia vietnamiensis]
MGKFFEKVRHGRVVGPRKREFTLEGWRAAYDEFSSSDKVDDALYASGRHIHAKLAAIRNATALSSLSRLSTETRIKAFVAAANHQFEALELKMNKRAEEVANANGSGELHLLELASTQVTLADGRSYGVESVLGSMLDGIAIPIKFALTGKVNRANDSFDDVNWNDVRLEANLGIFYDQAEGIWEDCVWNTYILAGSDGEMVAVPTNADAKKGTHAAAARKIALAVESFSYTAQGIKFVEGQGLASRIRDVRAIVTEGDRQHIELGQGQLSQNSQAMLFALRTMACPPYYQSLVDEEQSRLAGATLSQLFDGWMMVSQAAKRLWESTSQARETELSAGSNSVSDMSQYIPFFTTDALVAAVNEGAGIPVERARAIVEFLTFRGRDKQEFWTQPLIPVGEASTRLYPVFGAIAVPPNLRFVLERWMAQLGIRLEERGPEFEAYMRSHLAEAVESSPILSQHAKVITRDYTFRCGDGSFAQCDAIFCVGSSVFVVEAKCILEPTESTSIGTHRAAIEHAVEQANTRVQLIEAHREEFIKDVEQFGWGLAPEFRVYPLVAVSTVAHVGIPCDGVPVVDEFVLGRFFAGGYEYVGLDTGDFSVAERVHHAFFSNVMEAEASAPRYFEQPPQLQQYSAALRPCTVPIYRVTEGDWGGFMIDLEQS